MSILVAEKLSKSYSEKILFEDIYFSINEGEKIGVIGINGTGKSTLLKILAGEEESSTGKITKINGLTMAYLEQEPIFDEGTTVLQQVFKGDYPLMQLLREYEDALMEAENSPKDREKGQKLIWLSEKMDSSHGWAVESEAKTILTKLGILDFHQEISLLSGGQKKRVAMAGALIAPVDLLIMDEPTNHIDNDTVDWLEQYLSKYSHTLIMVTHDRYFLDRVSNKILEIDQGNIYTYQGNYSQFLELKSQRMELEQGNERKRQNLLRRELEWIRRGAKARTTKQKARKDRYEELSSQKGPSEDENVEINTGAARLGRKTIELSHIDKSYDKKLIEDFSYTFLRDDRIGIVGANGSGKSTLLGIINEKVSPDRGTVDIGETIKIGIFEQTNEAMEGDLRVIEYIRNVAEYVDTKDGKLTASQMLENFLFPSSLQWTPVKKLSGGEKRRLYLLKVLMGAPNVLLLDEPTNDLDIETLAILEGYLDAFPGIVAVVSHDRYFLDRVVNRIFAFEGNGAIAQYEGGYSDYRETAKEKRQPEEKSEKSKPQDERKKQTKLKFTYNEQKEYETIDETMAKAEESVKIIDEKIAEAGSDYMILQEFLKEKEKLQKDLDDTIERWIYLNELADKIADKKE